MSISRAKAELNKPAKAADKAPDRDQSRNAEKGASDSSGPSGAADASHHAKADDSWRESDADKTLEITPSLDESQDGTFGDGTFDLHPGMEVPSKDSIDIDLGDAADELVARVKAAKEVQEKGSSFVLPDQSSYGSEAEASSRPRFRGHDRNSNRPPSIDGFDVLGRIGQGSMGTVWRARELSTEREVAIKFLDARRLGSDLARARFEREVKLTARLEHPYIARVYTTGLAEGVYYYAMELVEGTTLERFVRREEYSHDQVLELVLKVCEAVDYAHSCGVVHRDLKPSNIIINNRGEPRIVDFGLAKPVPTGDPADPEATLSTEGQITGTPGYMSPEQAAGRVAEIDHRSDVYGLGAMLFKLLLQEYPHEQKGALYEVTQRIAEEDIRRPRDIDPSLDRDLEAILVKSLAKDQNERYPNASVMAADIKCYLTHGPVNARRLTLWYTMGKRLRRHRIAAAVAGVLIAMYLTTVIVLLSFVFQAQSSVEEERTKAQAMEERYQWMFDNGIRPSFPRPAEAAIVPPEEGAELIENGSELPAADESAAKGEDADEAAIDSTEVPALAD